MGSKKTLKRVNVYKRRIFRFITKNLASTREVTSENFVGSVNIKRVLITRPNHRLGNQLLITPLVCEVENTFPNAKIDLVVNGTVAPEIFKNYPSVDRIVMLPKKPFKNLLKYIYSTLTLFTRKYDVSISAVVDSSSSRIFAAMARARYKVIGEFDTSVKLKTDDQKHIAKFQIYTFRDYFNGVLSSIDTKAIPTLNLKLSKEETIEGKNLLNRHVNPENKTIALFTYATGAKCLSELWWMEFYKQITNEFPNYNFIEILPVENVSQIQFKAPAYYSKDIREITSVIQNCELFIGADSGIMHLASSSGTKTLGLFSVSDMDKYCPYGNGSKAIHAKSTTIEKFIQQISYMLENNEAISMAPVSKSV